MENFNIFSENKDADELLAYLLAEEGIEQAPEQKIHRREKLNESPISFAQQRLWFLSQMTPNSPAYNISSAVRLTGRLNVAILKACLNEIVQRHEVLRTTFSTVGGQAVPRIIPTMQVDLPVMDFQQLPEDQREAEVQRLIAQEIQQPFDLAQGPLLRTTLFSLGEAEYVFLFIIHHIIFDGWSRNVLVGELAALYDAFSQGKSSPLPELPIQYADFAVWQQQWLSSDHAEAQIAYWKQQLAHFPLLQLPTDQPRPKIQTLKGATQSFVLPEHLSHALQVFSKSEGVTLFTLLLAVFKVLLSRYTGQTDLMVGVPIANRNQLETEPLIGLFVNTLVLRIDLSGDPSFQIVLERVRTVCMEAFAHQEIPFEKVVDALQPERDLGRSPLFQVMFDFQHIPSNAYELFDVSLRPLEIEDGTAKFDLEFNLWEGLEGISGSVEYNTDIYNNETIVRLIRHYQTLLAAIIAYPQAPISTLSLLGPAEYQQVTTTWNDTHVVYSHTGLLHQLFEQQVERTPDAVAVVYAGEQLSYHALNQRANQLAHYLQAAGVHAETRVGICMERSLAMVVGLLGILKAGGAYVPLDPTYPKDRLAFLLEDAHISVLLTQAHLMEQLPEHEMRIVQVDALWDEIAQRPSANLQVALTPEHAAYVIYTSGSTGRPKGVIVTHAGICNRLLWMQDTYQLTPEDRVLQKTPFSFDVSVWEFFWPLIVGSQLVVAQPGGHQDAAYLIRLIAEHQITTLHFVPPMLQIFLEEEALPLQTTLKRVICSGEALPFDLQERFFACIDAELHNLYGPTEASIDVTFWACDRQSKRRVVPLGHPIANTQIYILDAFLQPVPVGIPGELHIGGIGLARGYLYRPELTAENFIPNPFSQQPGARLYKTGDLARLLIDGTIEFLGRIDHQVKIRGFRIELGEIETVLSMHRAVSEVVILAREDEQALQHLVAYLVPNKEQERFPTIMEFHAFLKEKLPTYMIPSAFVVLEALPLTSNGKINRRALPLPGSTRPASMGTYKAPRTLIEEVLAAIWSRVLGVEHVGIDDNFFALGGDSIRSVQVLSQAKEQHFNFSLQQLFQYQTIRELAHAYKITEVLPAALPSTQPFSLISPKDAIKLPDHVEDAYPLSMLQAGMIFHNEYDPHASLYHNVDGFRLRMHFDLSVLQSAAQWVVSNHAIMRTAFDLTTYSKPLQLVYKHVEVRLYVEDLRHLPSDKQEEVIVNWIEAEKKHFFDLTHPPLVRFQIHHLGDDVFQFTLPHHHTILDGWSVSSLMMELLHTYIALLKREPLPIYVPRSAFRDFVALEQSALKSEECQKYWQDKLATANNTALPRWFIPHHSERTSQYQNCKISFPPHISDGLKNLAHAVSAPLKSVLLAAHLKVLSFIGGQREVLTGLASDTRVEDGEGDRVLGVYLNSVPFYLQLPKGSWVRLIQETLQAECELLPFRRYPLAQLQRDLGRNPLFEILFNFTHFHVLDDLSSLNDVEIIDGYSFAHANFALTVSFDMDLTPAHSIHLLLSYNETLLCREQIECISSYYMQTLEAMVSNPFEDHEVQCLLSARELHLFETWNTTQTDYPKDHCIHQLFEIQVEKSPHAVAVTFEETHLTYQDLDQRANQVAHYLQSRGVDTEVRVGICMERSLEMIIGILGILKAGGVYVPLDPSYPQERLIFLLKDANVAVLITQKRLIASLPTHEVDTLCLDGEGEEELVIAHQSRERVVSTVKASNLAYIMYTSGSTGKPKGVAIEQRGVVRLVKETNYLNFSSEEFFLQFAPISFDASTFELWGCLLNGARLVIFPAYTPSLEEFGMFLQHQQITTLWLAAGFFQQMVDEQPKSLHSIQQLLTGGDIVSVSHARKVLQQTGKRQLINGYGPTENTTFASYYSVADPHTIGISLPIGRPVANTQIYILDQALRRVPIGVPGELYISGAGLARCYINQPALTAEMFIPNPFSPQPGSRLYKTGDLARFLVDGAIEFLGRIDQQVKLRGFRIELGEIEALLSTHAAVSEVVVLAREDRPGDKRLVAYVVLQGADPPSATQLRAFLAEKLPSYMVPSAILFLEQLPLTANGKVNYRNLPSWNAIPLTDARPFVAPRTHLERVLTEIWSDVLDVPLVSVDDNFFELGGHSLLATQIIARMRAALSIELSLRDLFAAPSIAKLAEVLIERTTSPAQVFQKIMPRRKLDPLLLSFAQQRLWFLNQLDPANPSYNVYTVLRLPEQVNVDILRQSLQAIVQRHEILRTTFTSIEGEPWQIISSHVDIRLSVQDLSSIPTKEPLAKTVSFAIQEVMTPFDLTQGPLLRATLLRLNPEENVLLLTIHHIIFDGWSIKIFAQELKAFYTAFSENKPVFLPELPIQYTDFALWQRKWFQGEVFLKQLTYWKKQLDKKPHILDLPTDRPRPAVKTSHGKHQLIHLSPTLHDALVALSQREGTTLFMTLLSAFAVLLFRYTQQEDISIGTPVANRNYMEVEQLIGFFVNTLVICIDLHGNPSFLELLRQVRDVTLAAYEHQDLPFEKLVEEIAPERDLGRTPLFQVMFSLQQVEEVSENLLGSEMSRIENEKHTAKFDFDLLVINAGSSLHCIAEYNTDLFDDTTIEQLLASWETLLSSLVTYPQQAIGKLPLLTPAQEQLLLEAASTQIVTYPVSRCLHQIFEDQVARTPGAVAVICNGKEITYQTLNEQANQLARYLQAQGVEAEVLVGLGTERSIDMILGILGILKAGGAYVPLDPTYPTERLAFTLADASPLLLITQQALIEKFTAPALKIICLDRDWPEITHERTENLATTTLPEHLAYIIYTSGSTGTPKGVMISHANVVRLFAATDAQFHFSADDTWTFFHSYAFDFSVWELWGALLYGGKLVVVSYEASRSPDIFADLLRTHHVTVLNQTPSAFYQLVSVEETAIYHNPLALRLIIFGGEALDFRRLTSWCARYGDQQPELVNMYGITETTVHVTAHRVSSEDLQTSTGSRIGIHLSDLQLYLLDEYLHPVPIGVAGQIYVGGAGLGRGYLRRPELTAERFIPHPFSPNPGARFYATGDLARLLPSGNLEYLGRSDHQVKIRGFRIELGEIEAVLRTHPAVKEVLVITREDLLDDKRLAAYIILRDAYAPSSTQMRSFLEGKLPSYMVPTAFLFLEQLPLTVNGKVDRRALPALSTDLLASLRTVVAPRTSTEHALAALWCEVLGVQQVSIHDNFFELGGHSLLAVRLLYRIKKQFGREVPLSALFQGPTIETLARIVNQQDAMSDWSPLVKLQHGSAKRPFFCVHPIGGNILCYADLARHLGSEQPFYGLQASGFENDQAPYETIEKMATHYVQAIQTVQTEGPYLLGGWSMGGIIALEIAQQLRAQGHEISLLALLDSWIPLSNALSSEDEGMPIAAFMKEIEGFLENNVEEELTEQAHRLTHVVRTHYHAFLSYVPKEYPKRITLFLPQESLSMDVPGFSSDWSKLTLAAPEVCIVPGDHYSMMAEPHIQSMAEQLRYHIDEVEKR